MNWETPHKRGASQEFEFFIGLWAYAIDLAATDSAITIAVIVPLIAADDPLSYLGLATLVTGFLTPYIRAKAESFGIECSVGIAERTERLIIILTAVGFHGLGVPYILAIGLWLLAILGVITVFQRMAVVRRGLTAR